MYHHRKALEYYEYDRASNKVSLYITCNSLGGMMWFSSKIDSPRIKITELYAVSYVFLKKMEDVIYSIQPDKVIPLVISNIVTDTFYVSARPVDKEALAMNHEFRESIKLSREWFRFMVGLYEATELEIAALMGQIENEIEDR